MKGHKILLDKFARIEIGYIDPPNVQDFLEVSKEEETLGGNHWSEKGNIKIMVSNASLGNNFGGTTPMHITLYKTTCPKKLYEIVSKFAEELEKYAKEKKPVMKITKEEKFFVRVAHRDNLVKLNYYVDGYKEDIMRQHPDYLDDNYAFNFVEIKSLFE